MANLTSEERRLAATGRIDKITPRAPAAAPAPAPVATPEAPAAAPAAPAAEVPAATPETPESTPAAPDTPAATPEGASPEGEQPGSEGNDGTKRFRFSSEDDKAVAQLAKSRGISLIEASRIYAGEATSAPAAAPAAPVAPPAEPAAPAPDPVVVDLDRQITESNTRLTELIAQRDEATDNLDQKAVNKLNDQIADLKTDVRLLETEKKGHVSAQENQAKANYRAKVDASRDRAFSEFKVFANPDSQERLVLDTYVNRALADPKRKHEFNDPSWPEKLAKECATKYGIKPAAAAGPAPAPAVPAAPKPPAALPKPAPQQVTTTASGPKLLTGADGRQSSASRQPTPDEVRHAIRTDPAARKAIRQALFNTKPG